MAKNKADVASPDRAALHQAALRHLARFAATEAGLRRVLERRVQRWARDAAPNEAELARAMVLTTEVSRGLVAAGLVDDAAFAAARAARLTRSGKSRRSVAAHLAAKGVDADAAAGALPGSEAELSAAAIHARKRRMGPFRTGRTADTDARDLAAFGRAGFGRDAAQQILAMGLEEADALVMSARRDR